MKYDYQNYTDIRFEQWRHKARCVEFNVDPELFFPISVYEHRVEQAKAICQTCVVQQDCLQEALDNRYMYGIWGGRLFTRYANGK